MLAVSSPLQDAYPAHHPASLFASPPYAAALSAGAAEPVATLAAVSKRYGSVTALDGFSLSLRPGEIVALLGPNGAGKSTAVRLLLGLIAPDAGQARLFGQDPRAAPTRTRIGAMLQVASIPKTLTVREHLELFRAYYPAPLPFADIVRIAHLRGIEDRLFEKLSGGQRQRLLFGLALCGNPAVVVLDEPTVGLDIEARRALWQQIRALAAEGRTVLLTTHYLEEADALAHRIVVLNHGKVVAEGTPAAIKAHTGTRTIHCRTLLPLVRLKSLPGILSVTQANGVTTLTASQPETILRALLHEDPTLRDLEVTAPGLEEAFLALTAH